MRDDHLLADGEVLARDHERVLRGDQHDEIVASRASDAQARAAIIAALAAARADLAG